MGNVTEGDQERLTDPFVIDERSAKWKAMAREVAGANSLVPSSLASRVQDLYSRGWWTAETYSYFLMFLGPIILKDRLPLEYYRHFLALSQIARTITRLEIEVVELEPLRKKIAQWALDYERLYYQYRESHMPFCTAPIHAMLHVVDYIEWQGPPCRYWCFCIERYGGWLKKELNNNQLPVVALSNRVIKQEQIYQVIADLQPENRQKVVDWARGKKYKPTWAEGDVASQLYDILPKSYRLSQRVIAAIQGFLQARSYSPTHYDQAYDWNQRRHTGLSDFRRIDKPQYGEILHFVEFPWSAVRGARAQMEMLQVAVVQPWITTPLLEGEMEQDLLHPPYRLVQEISKLQVMEVKALRHVAGRIPIDGSNKWVIFEPSLGSMIPDMV
ncbi:hypothetical protein QFC20_003172 [Naganishia adeliensis]|uniref:Uncharacterized protein n=1 Tax=Naganishia adeliensis TaxID=92952 RepID=A0ACC2WE86_9TREE|nr:hypothetical protein QFC20_003172 [Naganishia adeliensis]